MADFLDRYGLQLRSGPTAPAAPCRARLGAGRRLTRRRRGRGGHGDVEPRRGASGGADRYGHDPAAGRHLDSQGRAAGQGHAHVDRPYAGLTDGDQGAGGAAPPADRPRSPPRRAAAALRRPSGRGASSRRGPRPRARYALVPLKRLGTLPGPGLCILGSGGGGCSPVSIVPRHGVATSAPASRERPTSASCPMESRACASRPRPASRSRPWCARTSTSCASPRPGPGCARPRQAEWIKP